MTLKAIQDAIMSGDVSALSAALATDPIDWCPPQRVTHPIWALIEKMESAQPYPWVDVLGALHAGGMPHDPWIEAPHSVRRKSRAASRYFIGLDHVPRHYDRRQGAGLFARAVGAGTVEVVRAFVDAGFDPSQPPTAQAPTLAYFDSPWHAFGPGKTGKMVAAILAAKAGLPPGAKTADWLESKGRGFAPDHPVWSALPSGKNWWSLAVKEISLAGSNGVLVIANWWLARPQDRNGLAAAAAEQGVSLWPVVVAAIEISRDTTLLDETRARFARVGMPDPTLRLDVRDEVTDRSHHEQVPVPLRQWLRHRHGQSHWFDPQSSDAKDFTPTLISLTDGWQPDWTAAGEGPWTEGELAVLSNSAVSEDDALWCTNPEWIAPHCKTGRTPLWHVTDEESAHRWCKRGLALDAVDASGNQAFAWLVARAMRQDRSRPAEIGNWALARLRDGTAPLDGSAGGRALAEWASGRKDLAVALARRRKAEGLGAADSPDDALFARCIRLDIEGVRYLLASGADPGRADALGQTPLQATLNVRPAGPKGRAAQARILDCLLNAGAPYVQPDGQGLLDRYQKVLSGSSRSVLNENALMFRTLLRLHEHQDAPWSNETMLSTINTVIRLGAWQDVAPTTRVRWRERLLDPSWGPQTDRALATRLKLLADHLLPHLDGNDLTHVPGLLAAWESQVSRPDLPEVAQVWRDWRADAEPGSQKEAWWSALALASTAITAVMPRRLRM